VLDAIQRIAQRELRIGFVAPQDLRVATP